MTSFQKLFTIGLLFFASLVGSLAQTNNTTNVIAKTNATKPALTLEKRKVLAITRLNQFWNVERDFVREESKISLKTELAGRSYGLTMNVYCSVSQPEPVPDDFAFHFSVRSSDWQFLHSSWFIINYDGFKKDFGQLEVTSDVGSGARTLEQMFAHVTYDEFLKIAYARTVVFNLGHIHNLQIMPADRAAWQCLIEYFEVIKAEQKFKASGESKIAPSRDVP